MTAAEPVGYELVTVTAMRADWTAVHDVLSAYTAGHHRRVTRAIHEALAPPLNRADAP